MQSKLQNKSELILIVSLSFVFIAMTIMSFWFGISGDEPDMNLYGKAILRYFSSFGQDDYVFSGDRSFDRDGVIKYYGGLFDFIAAIINKVSPFAEFTTRHILNAWAGFLAIFFASKIAKRIGGVTAGVLVVWVMFLSPFFLGHAMNNPKDIPFAAAYVMALWLIIRLFDKLEGATWKDYLWPVLAIGAAINIRVGGILLLPYLLVISTLIIFFKKIIRKEELSFAAFVKPIGILAIAGYLAGSILWPFAIQSPISNPIIALQELSDFKINLAQIWEGEKVWSNELPKTYLLKTFGITNTLVLLLGLALGVVLAFTKIKKSYAEFLAFIIFTGVFPVAYIIYSGSNVYHAWRHVLFVFPPLAITAACGWVFLSDFFKGKMRLVIIGISVGLLIEPLVFTIKTFPNTNTYHNFLAGGVEGAYGNYEVDFYYNSVKEVQDWFFENEFENWKKDHPNDTVVISTNAYFTMHEYTRPIPNAKAGYMKYNQRNEKDWDYLVLHTALIPLNDIKSGNWIPSNTLYEAKVEGKTMCILIKRTNRQDLNGNSLAAQGKVVEALNAYQSYLTVDENNTVILNKMANLCLQNGRVEDGLKWINKSYQLDNSKLETKQIRGLLHLQNNDAKTAISMFSQIMQENKDFNHGFYFIALAQQQLGQDNEALKNFKTASELLPNLKVECYQNMAQIYQKQGKTEQVQRLVELIQKNGRGQ